MSGDYICQVRFTPHTTYYNNFFLLRIPVTINGQLAQVGYSGNEELTLNCRYPSINISLSMVSNKLESILRKHGVSQVVNFWCEEVLLVHTTFSSEHGLRRLLRLKEKAQDEIASLLSAELMVQCRPTDTRRAALTHFPTAVKIEVFLIRPDSIKNTAQVEAVSLANHSACLALWKESEVFNFSSLFRAYRVDPSKLPEQGAVTLKNLVSELHDVVNWFGLGLQLDVPDTELMKIRYNYRGEVDRCKTEVFIWWMKQVKPTWSAVVRALVGIKLSSMAHKIAIKYGVATPISTERKPILGATFVKEKQNLRQQQLSAQIEQIEKGLEAKEKQAEERRERLVKAQREKAIVKHRFAQARKNALDVQMKTTRLIEKEHQLETQLELKQYELKLLSKHSASEKDKHKLKLIIANKDAEIKNLQGEICRLNTELEATRRAAYDFREKLQQVTKELEVKSAEVRQLERARLELRDDLDWERKRVDMLMMQRSNSHSGDKYNKEIEYQTAELKKETEFKSREVEACKLSVSQKEEKINELSLYLKEVEEKIESLLVVRQPQQGATSSQAQSGSEPETQLQALVLETSDLKAKLVEAEDYKQEAVRQLEMAQKQIKQLQSMVPVIPIEEEEWFFGNIRRELAEIKCQKDGDYLVRYSSRNNKYVLTCRWNGERKHFIVQEVISETSGEVMYRFESEASPSICELLKHHITHCAPITTTSGALLQRSVTKYDKWLLQRTEVRMDKWVKKGSFSCDVWEATLVQDTKKVSVKACPTQTDSPYNTFEFILNEAEILKSCNHPNIVKLVGVCEQDPAFTVLEFVQGSNFLNYLQTNVCNSKKICALCADACSGMAYLESMNIIHRDLGARSCLVTENSILKISEFGISCQEVKGTYILPRGGIQAIKWTAPEVLNYGQYTCSSDVWSFGILLWEAFSCGSSPYPDMSNQEARMMVDTGYRMPLPAVCPPEICELVQHCWQYNPADRPQFSVLLDILKQAAKKIKS